MSALAKFRERLYEELLPQFADDPSRGYGRDGFRDNSAQISEVDARDFLRAIDGKLVRHLGRGIYSASMSSATEQLFWEFEKAVTPRPYAIWLEPIITIAAVARMHFDHGWPVDLIGTQSKKGEFDLVGYLDIEARDEHLAGEIKKSPGEVASLLTNLASLSGSSFIEPDGSATRRNSIKKYNGLVERRAKVFWVLGPGGLQHVFRVTGLNENRIVLTEATPDVLDFPSGD